MAKKPLPQFIEPMMTSVVRDPFDNTDWIFETKLDGYRAIAVSDSASRLFGKQQFWWHLQDAAQGGYDLDCKLAILLCKNLDVADDLFINLHTSI